MSKLLRWIENIQFTTFAYLLIASVSLLSIGFLGRFNIVPLLNATGAAADVISTFHTVVITSGFVFLGLAIAALIIFVEVS